MRSTTLSQNHEKFVIVLLIALILASQSSFPRVNASPVVAQHVFAKGIDESRRLWTPINVTDTFNQNDNYTYSYATFTVTDVKLVNFTWVWYDPSGKVYQIDHSSFACPSTGTTCALTDSLAIVDTNAAAKLGMWRMSLLADGQQLYSDSFQIEPYVESTLSWTFNLTAPMRAHITLDIAIYPYHTTVTSWHINPSTNAQGSNFAAYDYSTNKPLGLIHHVANSEDQLTILFGKPEGDGYTFILSFDMVGAFGTIGNDTLLDWDWGYAVNPIPMNVTVVLPASFALVPPITGVSNYTTRTINDRAVVSFSSTTAPNAGFRWTLYYAHVMQPTIATTMETTFMPSTEVPQQQSVATTSVSITYLTLAVAIVAVALIMLFILKHRKRKSA